MFAKTMREISKYIDINDFIFLFGLGIVGRGIWLIHPPSSLIFTGLIFMILAVLRGR